MSYGSAPDGLDLDFYARANPGIAESGVDPATHYELYGRKEGRAANAQQLSQGLWSQVTRDQSAQPSAPADPQSASYATNPYGFDAKFYLDNNPDVAAAKGDPLQHYLTYGINEGRARNDYQAAGGLGSINAAAGQVAPPPASTAPLNPTDPAAWASFKQRAHDATAGINRMPNVAPPTASLSEDPLAVRAQFYPKANNYGYVTAGYGGAPVAANGSAMNLGMGSIPPEMMQALMAQGFKG